jgi:arylsulfatase A-like enzyme
MDNVLLVTIDSLRADHVGYHGYERETTPFIDSLADAGSTFTNAFAHIGGTRFAFPSILSGVSPLMYGGYQQVSDDQTLVSEAFREGGYRTGGFHSNLYLSAEFGYDAGFDEFFDSKEDPSLASRARSFVRKNLDDSPIYPLLQRAYDTVESSSGINVGSYHVPADEITDMALAFAEEAAGTDRPAFLWVHYMDVHHPFLPPAEYQRKFREDVVGDRESIKLRRKLMETPGEVTDEELSTVLDLYDAEIRYTDDEIRRLVETVREAWDGTLVALTSDHGEHFLEHGYFSGAQPYDVKLHVPLLVEGEGWDDDGSYDELVGLTDLPPTLLDAVGLDVPASYQGESLRRLVFEGTWERTELMGGWGEPTTYAYRDLEWKYIERPEDGDELYDLAADPGETDNVIDDHPDVVERLAGRLVEHREEVARTDADVDEADLDEDVRERLRRLGYQE